MGGCWFGEVGKELITPYSRAERLQIHGVTWQPVLSLGPAQGCVVPVLRGAQSRQGCGGGSEGGLLDALEYRI